MSGTITDVHYYSALSHRCPFRPHRCRAADLKETSSIHRSRWVKRMSGVFSRGGVYSPDLAKVLERLDGLVDWEHRGRVRGASRLMRVSSAPARALLDRLGLHSPSFRAVHVSGSKGKGSVAALIACGLSLTNTGVFSSPHVERVNERIGVRGRPISDASLAAALTRVLDARESAPVVEAATWFDVITAAALSEFEREGVSHAVVEAGMGGRRDATAVVRAPVSVITNIYDEHANIIGPARSDIAAEKAGVIAPGAHVVLGMPPDDPVAHIFAAEAASQTPPARIVHVPPIRGGPLFAHNLAMARAALEPLGGSLAEEDARAYLRTLPARQEPFVVGADGRRVDVVLDGAHIPRSVAAVLRESGASGAVVLLGLGSDKKADEICTAVREAGVAHVVVTAAGTQDVYMQPDTLAAAMLGTGFDAQCVSVERCPNTALREAVGLAGRREAAKDRKVIVVGSLHVGGKVRCELRRMAASFKAGEKLVAAEK